MKTKKRILSTALAVLLGVSAVLPTANVFAEPGGGGRSFNGPYYPKTNAPYTFNLSNHHTKADYDAGKKLTGAKYDLNLIGDMSITGAIVPINGGEAILTKATIDEVNKKELNAPGRYELIQVERPFGYLLGQGTDENGNALKKVVVDFPIIDEKGQIAEKQVYNIAPKFTKVEKDFNLKKLGDNEKALADVEFKLYALGLAEEGKYNELYGSKITKTKKFSENKANLLVATGKSGADGKVIWNNGGGLKLAEGSYYLEESAVPEKSYKNQAFFVTLKAKEGKERTAESLDDFEFVITRANTEKTVVATEANGEVVLHNYKAPTPGNGDGTTGSAEFSKKVVNVAENTTVQEGQNYSSEATLTTKDHAQFKINFTIPKDAKAYDYLAYVDELNAAYTLVESSVVVKAGTETNPSWIKVTKSANNLTLTPIATEADAKNVIEGQEVTVEFVVKVNRDIAVHGSTINNGLRVDYGYPTNNPTIDPNGNDPAPNPEDKPGTDNKTEKLDPKDETKTPIINSKTTIRTKDIKTKEDIANGTFIIEKKDEKGNYKKVDITPEIKTDENGVVVIEDLPTGDYRIVNTKAPDGYKRKAAPQEFSIKPEDGKKTIENERIFYYDKDDTVGLLPSTGTLGTLPYLLSATLLLGVFVALRKRNAEER